MEFPSRQGIVSSLKSGNMQAAGEFKLHKKKVLRFRSRRIGRIYPLVRERLLRSCLSRVGNRKLTPSLARSEASSHPAKPDSSTCSTTNKVQDSVQENRSRSLTYGSSSLAGLFDM